MTTERSLVPHGFAELQSRLAESWWDGHPPAGTREAIVVVPSITYPSVELRKIIGIQRYEERMLFVLLLLDDPGVGISYITSLPIDEAVIDYYLGFTTDPTGCRTRLRLFSADDPEPRALSSKLLERPDLLASVRDHLGTTEGAYVLPFNVTPEERAVAERLGIPLYGTHPDLAAWGSKSGSRRAARRAGVEVFAGQEDLCSLDEVEAAAYQVARRLPEADAVVIKLNNGFSGQGNAIIDIDDLRSPITASRTIFCASEESWPSFGAKIAEEGAIVEELVRAAGTTSPSVQMRVTPAGSVEVMSTHDQVLGGPDEQVYLGCRFPAHGAYRKEIQQAAVEVGRVLASEGVIGPFGIDFVVIVDGDDRRIYLSEINLRVGGTTHPFLMARLATGGHLDEATGELATAQGPRVYLATDNLKSETYLGLEPAALIAGLRDRGLAYDDGSKSGVMPHLLGALGAHGKLGVTCVARSGDEADHLLAGVTATLDDLGPGRG